MNISNGLSQIFGNSWVVLMYVLLLFILVPISFQAQTPISYGDCVQDSISLPSEIDVYTFSGNENDIITVSMGRSSGSLWPRVEVVDLSNGNLLISHYSTPSVRVDTLRLPHNGTYAIRAMDGLTGTLTGEYGLCLQRTFNPGQADSIQYGMTVLDTVEYAAFMNTYTFSGNENDIITIQMGRSSGSLWPQIELYDPNGNLLVRIDGASSARIDTLKLLAISGSYMILAMDGLNGTLTGEYGLSVQRTFDPGLAPVIEYNTTIIDTITLAGQINAYTFSGHENDVITILMGRTAGSLWPRIELYDPNGTLLQWVTNPTSARIDKVLSSTGFHTILAMDGLNGTLTGIYSLNLTGIVVSIEEKPSLSLQTNFELYQNYPNPFNPSTTIEFLLPRPGFVRLKVFNSLGEEIANLVNQTLTAGKHKVLWDATGLAGGFYIYRLEGEGFVQSKKLLLLK